MAKMVKYIIEEFNPEFPWWDEIEDHDDYVEAVKSCNRYAEAWSDTKFRIVKVSREIVYEKDA